MNYLLKLARPYKNSIKSQLLILVNLQTLYVNQIKILWRTFLWHYKQRHLLSSSETNKIAFEKYFRNLVRLIENKARYSLVVMRGSGETVGVGRIAVFAATRGVSLATTLRAVHAAAVDRRATPAENDHHYNHRHWHTESSNPMLNAIFFLI